MGFEDGRGEYDPARNDRRWRTLGDIISNLLGILFWWN
jgi:hypothetical protein